MEHQIHLVPEPQGEGLSHKDQASASLGIVKCNSKRLRQWSRGLGMNYWESWEMDTPSSEKDLDSRSIYSRRQGVVILHWTKSNQMQNGKYKIEQVTSLILLSICLSFYP